MKQSVRATSGKPSRERSEPGAYSLQWVDVEPGRCVDCSRQLGRGLVGLKHDPGPSPLCHACMIAGERRLGMLWLIADLIGEIAGADASEPEWSRKALALLGIEQDLRRLLAWPDWPLLGSQFIDAHAEKLGGVDFEDILRPSR